MIPVNEIICGDCLEVLQSLHSESVNCCVTSPPYWGLRDYGVDGQLGMEKTPDVYVEKIVAIFSEVKRVLKKDGTLWLNLGDSYNSASSPGCIRGRESRGIDHQKNTCRTGVKHQFIKKKDMCAIPWRVALAFQSPFWKCRAVRGCGKTNHSSIWGYYKGSNFEEWKCPACGRISNTMPISIDGWYLRQDIIWHKPNPMPESVRDRCTKAHEYLFLLSKSRHYYYDIEAIKEDAVVSNDARPRMGQGPNTQYAQKRRESVARGGSNGKTNALKGRDAFRSIVSKKNKRSVWTVPLAPFHEAHFATYPPDLIEPCILAGCPEGGIVLDPFMGSGTTGMVAARNNRNYIGIELNPEYIEIAKRRIASAETGVPVAEQKQGQKGLFE